MAGEALLAQQMEGLQQILRCRAHEAVSLLHEGICVTEQKLEHCIHCLGTVQEELQQQQAAQVHAIQAEYHTRLQELTDKFEQEVWCLQQQTQSQLAGVQSAAEEALQQAAHVLLQQLQPAPIKLAADAATEAGSPPGSDIGFELSLAALQQQQQQQQQGVQQQQQHMEGSQRQQTEQMHFDVLRASSSSQVTDLEDLPWRSTDAAASAASAQQKAGGPGLRGISLDDTQLLPLQDQEDGQPAVRHAAEQPLQLLQHITSCHGDWLQEQQPYEPWQAGRAVSSADADPQPARASASSPLGSAARSSMGPPGAPPSEDLGAVEGQQLQAYGHTAVQPAQHQLNLQASLARQHGAGSSNSSQQHGRMPRRSSSGSSSSSEAGDERPFATPTATPSRTTPWQLCAASSGSQPRVQEQVQRSEPAVPSRQLRAVTSLPARPHIQPSLRRCASSADHASGVLRRAPSLRQQLESSWQQGLAKAAGKAASSTAQEELNSTAASLSTAAHRRPVTAAGVYQGGSNSSVVGDGGGGERRKLQQAASLSRSVRLARWSSLARQDVAAAAADLAAKPAARSASRKSSSAVAGRRFSAALDLLP